ncbi:MAG TPA: ADOP family duplicated permease [Longimicrobiales bacterium]
MDRIPGLRRLLRGGRVPADAVEREIAHHLEERVDELMEAGLSRKDAEREARRAFGDVERVRRELTALNRRWERSRRLKDAVALLGDDVRHALRRLRRTPGFAAVVVLVLGLTIGANTAIFSALKAALLAEPPYPARERLVVVDLLMRGAGGAPADTMAWSYPKFELVRERLGALESMAAYWRATATLTGAGDAARIGVEYVSPSYFELLGVRPLLGRTFAAGEEPPAPGAVALLSHDVWATRFGGDPGVVGRTITLDGASLEVVGVLPRGFEGVSGAADLWVPMAGIATVQGPRRLERPQAHWHRAFGRLRPGTTLEAARAEAATLGHALDEAYPLPPGDGTHGVTMVPMLRARVNPLTRLAVSAVAAGAAILLLIACGNVAGLLLARASARRADVAVRAALGAARGRLLRESLLESLLLAAGGGALGLLLALIGERLVAHAVSATLETSGSRNLEFLNPDALAVDGSVVAAGIGLALLTGLLFGLLPARVGSRPDLTRDLRAGGRAEVGAGRTRGARGRAVLVAAQLALTLPLLAGTGLMAASFARLSALGVGFTNDAVLTLSFDHGPGRAPDQDRAFEAALLERVSALPGVDGAAIAPCAPLAGRCEVLAVRRIDDGPPAEHGEMDGILAYAVSDDYFRTLGIPLRAGRTFTPEDRDGGPPVAVVNEAAARKFFGGAALGHRIVVSHSLTADMMAEVVGVVGDVRYGALEEPAMPALYFSRRQAPSSYGTLFVGTRGDPYALVGAVRREAATLDPTLPLYAVTTMGERRAAATARTRVILGLLAAFGSTGLLLSAIGLYGLVSYAVVRRTPEMGLRVALGARSGAVLRLVLVPAGALAAAGAAAGIAAAAFLTRHAGALLFGVEPTDPRVLAAAAALLFAIALVAAWVPARRATRVDPMEALRVE